MWLVAKKSCDEFSAATVSLKASTIAVEEAEAVAEKLHKRIRLFQLLPKHSRQKSVLECQSSFILWSTSNLKIPIDFDNCNSKTTPAQVVFAQCEAAKKKAEDGRSEASDGILPFEWERAGGEMLGSKK